MKEINRFVCSALSLIILMILEVSAVWAQDNTKNREAEALRLNDEAVKQIDAEKYKTAIELLDQAIRIEPNYATAYYNLGTSYFHLQQFEKAAAAFQQAIKLHPTYAEAFTNLGAVYMETAQYEKAVEVFQRAVRLKTDNAVALYNLGCVYIRLNKFKEAIDSLELAAQLDEVNAEIRINLGYAYSREKRYGEAIKEMQKTVRLKPDDEQAQLFSVNLYLLTNNRQAAIEQYAAVKKANPHLAEKLFQMIFKGKIVAVSNK